MRPPPNCVKVPSLKGAGEGEIRSTVIRIMPLQGECELIFHLPKVSLAYHLAELPMAWLPMVIQVV